MSNPNKEKLDLQHRRISVFRTKRNRLIFYFKQNKIAYYIDPTHLRYVQLYFYRFQFALLVALVSFVITNFWWLAIIIWFLVVGLFEVWFREKIIKNSTVADKFEHPLPKGIIQSNLKEPSRVITIRIFAFSVIVVTSIIAAFYGEYSPAYLIGMLAIGAFGLFQVILLSYVQIIRKKKGDQNNGK
jgi:small-conductance mechanosensitive channel